MTRQQKTPRQRAEEQLKTAESITKRLTDQAARAQATADRLTRERDEAIARRDHLKQHPDLQQNPTSTSTGDPA